jgi:hypothetical protein
MISAAVFKMLISYLREVLEQNPGIPRSGESDSGSPAENAGTFLRSNSAFKPR